MGTDFMANNGGQKDGQTDDIIALCLSTIGCGHKNARVTLHGKYLTLITILVVRVEQLAICVCPNNNLLNY